VASPVKLHPRVGRRRRRRRVARLRLGVLAVGIALLAGLAAWLLASPRFDVACVEVVGAESLPNSLIVWQAAIPDGANIVRLRRGEVARRVAALPAVRSASVKRRLPHTVIIQVVEREPVLFVRDPRGALYLDREGVCFERCGERAPAVELVGMESSRFLAGRRPGDRRLPVALRTCARARSEGLVVRRMAVSPAGEMDLLLAGGAMLRLGEPARLTEKLHKARLALEALQDRGPIEYVDVSCPDAVVWKPVHAQADVEARASASAARNLP